MVTALDHRWANREEDLAVYQTLFDTALALSRSEHPTHPHTGALIFAIINCWEKDRRSVPMEVLSATLTAGEGLQEDLLGWGQG